jgi:hypothetical protein
MSSNERLIGRDDVDDLEAILAVSNTDVDEGRREEYSMLQLAGAGAR